MILAVSYCLWHTLPQSGKRVKNNGVLNEFLHRLLIFIVLWCYPEVQPSGSTAIIPIGPEQPRLQHSQ